MHNKMGWKNSVCLSLFCLLQRYIAWIAVFCNPTYCGQKYRLEKIIGLTGAIAVPSRKQDLISSLCIVGLIRPTNRAGKCAKSVYGTVLLALLLAIVSDTAFAACSAWRSPQKVWFNEYFFGSGSGAPPKFLEMYSTSNSFPTQWSGMSVDIYSGANTKITYPLNNTTATACTVANKTWLTHNAVGGLVQDKALVILRDSLGDAVDAYVFDNSSPPDPWEGAADNWAPSHTTGCTALDTVLTTQAGLSASTPKQANMLVLPNYGNKDMARTPDGGTPWDLTSNTGAGTTYTQCVSNNTNFVKTVDNSTPSPGTTVTFTLSLANTGNNALTGVTVDDFLPDYPVTGAPTFISAIPVNALDTVTQTTYAATDPNTATAGNATKIQWAPASIAAGTTAKLNIKMQVPANATQGYFYTNTAQTTGSVLPVNQTDFASITVGSPNVGSFVFSVTPASASTCSTALLSPKVTVTAMTGPNGTGSVDTAYVGNSVYLSASTANPKWYNSAGTLLATVSPAPAGSFVNGVATFYLKDATAETVTVSGLDTATYTPNVMQGASGNITFTSGNAGLVLIDGETLTPASAYSLSNPAYGVVEGRAHKVRATISSCGATDTSRTGNYSGTIGYTAGLNHPVGATAPTISTTATCPGSAVGAVTLPFVSGISDFYLCTSDVGQFTLNLSLTSPSVAGNTSNFTVRPFAITARDFAAGATANPQGAGAFTGAGYSFSGTLDAWGWRSTEDTNSDGVPDPGVLTSVFSAATHGQPLRFGGTTNAAGVINFGPKSPATGVLATTTVTATAGTVTLSNLTYSEVGVVTFAGTDVAGLYGATNYLGLSGLHVPLISDVVGHFTATTIATGSDPAVNTIAPGSSATDVNLFTLQTNSGTETITSVTVNLSSISGVGRLAITDNAGAELGFTTSPVSGSNTITVSGMTATSTLATFKVRVTPLSHAAMPLPTGGSYDITAPVTAWVGTNPHRGSDTNTNALTIDNLSPTGATATGGSVGNAKVTLNWTTSAAADFSTASGSVVYRWAAGAAGTEVPVEGSTPVVGSTNGTATVACVVSSAAASTAVAGKIDGTGGSADCTTAALTNGTTYTYKVFQKDVNGNYDTGVAVGAFIPSATTLADGVNPSNATIAPGAGITDLDVFTLKTDASTDMVTAVTVTLSPAGAFNNIAQVDLTDNSNLARCTAVTNPTGNTITFSACTSNGGIPVTTSVATYKIRITPKTHANMDAPPGASYATTGTVTAFTSTQPQAGTDGASATVTVDNASPAGATAVSGSAGNGNATLNWTTSAAADFSTASGSVVYRWAAGTAGTEVPVEGSTPVVGSANGTATVACVVSSAAASTAVAGKIDGDGGSADCTTAALTNGQDYTYKIFQKDSNGNYDAGVAVGTFAPSVITLADGVNPSNVTIAPGAGITDLDVFTLKTDASTDTVTAVTVTLGPAGAFNNIAQVDLTDNSNLARCTAVTNPTNNTITFSACTSNGGISVSTSVATYKIRITPKTHANMDAPPGASYATTGTVTAFTSTQPQAGTDGASAVVTIDNASPFGATAVSASVGDAKVTLNWTTSAAADFSTASGSVVYRWAAGGAGLEVPVEGSTPVVGSTNGTATVACVVSSAAASMAVAGKIDGTGGSADCTTAALTNGQDYTYKIFQKDVHGNYDVGAGAPMVTKSFNPSTIAVNATSILTITITNPDTVAISGLAFTDTYPVNLQNATTPALSNTCGGTATGTAGASVLSLSGGTLAASSSCSVSITVSVGTAGTYENSTVVTWTNGGSGTTASATLMTAVASPDHYELSLPTSGISCLPTAATVTACADTSSPCTNKYTDANGKTATLATNGGTLSSATVIFDATGVASTTLSYPAAVNGAVVSVTLSGEQAVASNSRQCCPDGTSCAVANSCSTAFSTGGFIFAASSGGVAATIPTQEAGTDSNTYSDTYLRAVKTNTATMACQAALTGAQTVNFGYECNNPTTCSSGNLMSVNGSPVAANNNGSAVSYSAVSTVFDANGNAPLIFNYSDVGLVTLHASKAAGGTLLSTLLGSSNAFVVKPAEFKLSDIKQTASPNLPNPGAVNASGAKFVKAGEAFSVTVTATTSGGTATPNYGQEATAESVKLTSALVTGLGLTTNPAVTYTSGFGAFSNGSATGTDFAWNEVGIITLTPSVADADYLGVGDVTGTNSGNVGRFIPDHFEVSGSLTNRKDLTCSPTSTFTYMGEPFQLALTVMAKNLTGTTTTKNYATVNNFAKLNPDNVGWKTLGGNNTLGVGAIDGSSIPLTSRLTLDTSVATTVGWVDGEGSLMANFTLDRPTSTIADATWGAYDALNLGVAPQDADGVTASTYTLDADVNSTAERVLIGASKLRLGRAALQNAFGSELLDLETSLKFEYYDGSTLGWRLNALDACTPIAGGNFKFSFPSSAANNLEACETAITMSGTAPDYTLILTKPYTVNTGWTDVTLNLGAAALGTNTQCTAVGGAGGADVPVNMPWLQFDWMGTGVDNPSARATFGIYKGNSRFIYIRELY